MLSRHTLRPATVRAVRHACSLSRRTDARPPQSLAAQWRARPEQWGLLGAGVGVPRPFSTTPLAGLHRARLAAWRDDGEADGHAEGLGNIETLMNQSLGEVLGHRGSGAEWEQQQSQPAAEEGKTKARPKKRKASAAKPVAEPEPVDEATAEPVEEATAKAATTDGDSSNTTGNAVLPRRPTPELFDFPIREGLGTVERLSRRSEALLCLLPVGLAYTLARDLGGKGQIKKHFLRVQKLINEKRWRRDIRDPVFFTEGMKKHLPDEPFRPTKSERAALEAQVRQVLTSETDAVYTWIRNTIMVMPLHQQREYLARVSREVHEYRQRRKQLKKAKADAEAQVAATMDAKSAGLPAVEGASDASGVGSDSAAQAKPSQQKSVFGFARKDGQHGKGAEGAAGPKAAAFRWNAEWDAALKAAGNEMFARAAEAPAKGLSKAANPKMDQTFWTKVSKALGSSGLKLPTAKGNSGAATKPPGGADCRRRWNELERRRLLDAAKQELADS